MLQTDALFYPVGQACPITGTVLPLSVCVRVCVCVSIPVHVCEGNVCGHSVLSPRRPSLALPCPAPSGDGVSFSLTDSAQRIGLEGEKTKG